MSKRILIICNQTFNNHCTSCDINNCSKCDDGWVLANNNECVINSRWFRTYTPDENCDHFLTGFKTFAD